MKQATTYRQLGRIPPGKRIVSNRGGTRCFAPETLVVTDRGNIPISEVKQGDFVKCFDTYSGLDEFMEVLKTHEMQNTKPTIRVKLKNGETIIATEDHEFYYKGGWHTLKHLLSLVEP